MSHTRALLLSLLLFGPASAADSRARDVVAAAIAAQGGEAKLKAIQNVQFDAMSIRYEVEQSERPEGPYIVEYHTMSEIHDQRNHRIRHKDQIQVPPLYSGANTWVANRDAVARDSGNAFTPASTSLLAEANEMLALAPERVLLTALESPDLHLDRNAVVGGVPQQVIGFKFNDSPVRVFLSRDTHLPSMVESSGALARNGPWAFLGDVTMQVRWTLWWMAKTGVRYPMQWNTSRNGLEESSTTLQSLRINAPIDDKQLDIPSAVVEKFRSQPPAPGLDSQALTVAGAQEIAPGLVQIAGSWNVALVDQGDGVVIIEAPISSGYSAKVISEAARRYPGKRIKAVVTTSDSWPHLAGIREYAAHGIPIYALGRNQPILNRVLHEPRTSKPDALSRAPRVPVFHFVSEKTTLGSGPNRIELYPALGAITERQMFAYFPEHRLLYGSDAFQKRRTGDYFLAQMVAEAMAAVERNNLQVDKFFMMHMGLTDWKELPAAIDKAIATDDPLGNTK